MHKAIIAAAIIIAIVIIYVVSSTIMRSAVKFVGCYKDTSTRALPTLAGTGMSMAQCITAAKNAGVPYFGMQNGNAATGLGECWLGSDPTKFGVATNCNPITNAATLQANPGAQMGGPWSNAVYRL